MIKINLKFPNQRTFTICGICGEKIPEHSAGKKGIEKAQLLETNVIGGPFFNIPPTCGRLFLKDRIIS